MISVVSSEKRKAQVAQAQARWRERNKEHVKGKKAAYRQKSMLSREIIAIRSKGVNVEDSHQLVLIGASTGDYLNNKQGDGLFTWKIFDDFLLPLVIEHPNAIFVSYDFSYDIRMMLRNISMYEWQSIRDTSEPAYILRDEYRVTWTKNRFSITFLKITGKPCISIYDVMDFFDSGVVGAIEKYLSADFTELEAEQFARVVEGKTQQPFFELSDYQDIEDYWWDEIRFLPKLVVRLRDSLYEHTGILISDWSNLTQITNNLLREYEADKYMTAAPDWVPVQDAFFGPRIEAFYVGHVGDRVYDYDINGAYGYALRWLPDLTDGSWVEIDGEDFCWETDFQPFGIYELEYESGDPGSQAPQPLPTRRGDSLLFPAMVETFVWGPEAWMVKDDVEVVRAWVFVPNRPDFHPLAELSDRLWDMRMKLRENNDPAESVIKQVLARMNGKFCQETGIVVDYLSGESVTQPKYRCLEYSGFLTSLTRARLYQAMMLVWEAGGVIYHCNTDGFVSNIDVSSGLADLHGFGSGLGEWKSKPYQDMVIVETNLVMLQTFPLHGKEWIVKKAGYGTGYRITFEKVMEQMSREDIWTEPMIFEGQTWFDEEMVWGVELKSRYLSNKDGKRFHTRNCDACLGGYSPAERPHILTLRR